MITTLSFEGLVSAAAEYYLLSVYHCHRSLPTTGSITALCYVCVQNSEPAF